LEDTSDFFTPFSETLKPEVLEAFKNFVASLILHHIENIPYNAISLSKLKSGEPRKIGKLDPTELEPETYGMAIFSLLSLCNHSCDPNSVPLRRPNNQTVSLIALKSIKAGEEVFISYAPLFTSMETEGRRRFLSQRYNFDCDCNACNNNWFVNLSEIMIGFNTNKSSAPAPFTRSRRRERETKTEMRKLRDNLEDVNEVIRDGKYMEGIEALKPFLSFLTRNFSSQFPLTLFAQELLKRALVILVNS
jgi:hypothetical protein